MNVEEKHRELCKLSDNFKPWELTFINMVLDGTDTRSNAEKYQQLRPKNTKRNAIVGANNLLKRSDAERYVQLQKELATEGVAEKLGITEEKVLREIASIAMVNPQDYLDEFGELKPLDELTREQAAAVRNFQEVRMKNGRVVYRYQLYDKLKGAELLGKTRAVKLFAEVEEGGLDIDGLLAQLKS